ncbi:extracellular solute-binding protein [Ectopseudomonas composti]
MKRLLALLLLLASTAQATEVVRIYGWKDYVDPQVLEDFQAQTGIRVDYQGFTTSDELLQALDAGTDHDLVMPSHFMLEQLIAEGHLAPLDTRQLRHYASLDPWLLSTLAGITSANRHIVPYMWGSIGMVVDPEQAQTHFAGPLPNSWSLLFDPQQAARLSSCGLGLLDAAEETSSLLLNYRGRRLSASSDRQIVRQLRSLEPVVPLLRTMDNWAFVDELVAGRLCLAMAWSGHAVRAMEGNAQLRYQIPDEGAAIYIDTLAIPTHAANPQLAYRLIDFLIDPPVAIRNAHATRFYPPLPSTAPAMQSFAAEHPAQVLTAEQRRRSYLLESLPPRQKQIIDDTWARVRAVRQ